LCNGEWLSEADKGLMQVDSPSSLCFSPLKKPIEELFGLQYIPLHRMFALFLCSAVHNHGFETIQEVIPGNLGQEFLLDFLEGPLRALGLFSQVKAGRWKRNGDVLESLVNSVYRAGRFQSSGELIIDADIASLQLSCSLLGPSTVAYSIASRFHVLPYLLQRKSPESETIRDLDGLNFCLEDVLWLIAVIATDRSTISPMSEDTIKRVISTLYLFGGLEL